MLDATILANDLDNVLSDFMQNQDTSNQQLFLSEFSKAIDNHFQLAIPSMLNVDIKPASGTLNIPASGSNPANATIIATAISNYFAMCITPTGIPQAGVITLVVNTAASIIPTLTADILSLIGKTQSVGYSDFAKKVIDNVKQITWTVTETLPTTPPSPMIFPNITLS